MIIILKEERDREFYRQYSALMLVLILLCLIAITAMAFVVTQRRARRRKEDLPKPKQAPYKDAWAEAGKRMDDSFVEFDDDRQSRRDHDHG